ncbi:MAG: hypothetical protein KA141_08500 [Rubrivivax sp.]|jgi:uncharacterized membrane protein|nr:hypothetical protein [Rubrivivax sp.]
MNTSTVTVEADASLVRITHLVYGLHALGLALGAFGAATVLGSFLFGWPSLIAVVINYVKRAEARGTWLESHFDWQIRTFWFALAWAVLVGLVSLPLTLIVVGFGTWVVGMALLGLWAIYRIARGWMRLNSHLPMPA